MATSPTLHLPEMDAPLAPPLYERFAPTIVSEILSVSGADLAMGSRQTTLRGEVSCKGISLHSGIDITMTLRPAPADTGIVFVRTDIDNPVEAAIRAWYENVYDVTLSSSIRNAHGHVVATVEHLMAALAGCRIDNALVEVDGPAVPVMDGSAQPFVDMIAEAGIAELDAARRVIRIKRPVRVEDGDRWCELLPENRSVFEAVIDFDSAAIGRQRAELELDDGMFDADIAAARTFCMLQEVEAMHGAGLALGGSLDNAIVIDGDTVLNPEGLRAPDEFARHKLLDAVGDVYLTGLPVIGRYRGHKAGHALHNKMLHALFLEPDAFELITLTGEPAAALAAE